MPIPIAAFLITFFSIIAGTAGYFDGKEHVQALWDAEKVMQAEKLNKAIADSRAKEQAAQAAVDQISKAKNAKLKTLSADYQRLAGELSKRPNRPDSTLPASTGADVGCTGAALPAPDAGFLAREAARADGLRVQLDACKESYDQMRAKINAVQ